MLSFLCTVHAGVVISCNWTVTLIRREVATLLHVFQPCSFVVKNVF